VSVTRIADIGISNRHQRLKQMACVGMYLAFQKTGVKSDAAI
jgi:hypothetical protein